MEGFLLLVALVLLAGVWSASVNSRIGFPVLIGFVAIGAILGPGGLHLATGFSPRLAKYLSYAALILILYEGGLHTSLKRIRRAWLPSLSLASVGVLISAAIMAALAHWFLRLPIFSAALIGAAVSSTDAASVFTLLRGQPIRPRLVDVLEVESGTNDPMAFFLTLILIQWSLNGTGPVWHAVGYLAATFSLQMVVGLVVGIAVGFAGSFTNQRIKLDTGGLYPTLSLAFALLSFSLAQLLHGSGLLAVYVASVVIGNRRLEHRYSIMRFHEGIAWTMHILMFVVLGLLLSPARLGHIAIPGLALALGGLFVARPAAVWISTVGMGFTAKEKHFLAWAGMRGAVPIVIILSAVIDRLPHYEALLDAVFFVVIVSAVAQGTTVGRFARFLDLVEPAPSENLFELTAIAREHAVVLPVEITEDSQFLDRKMVSIPFPPNTLCYSIIRGDRVIVPRGATRLKAGDHLLIMADRRQIEELKRLFQWEIVGEVASLP